jgi:hypothetical protein
MMRNKKEQRKKDFKSAGKCLDALESLVYDEVG